MRIRTKLYAGFLLVSIMPALLGYYVSMVNNNSFIKDEGRDAVVLAQQIINSIDKSIHDKIMETRAATSRSWIISRVKNSNHQFEKLANIEDHLAQTNIQWRASLQGKPTPVQEEKLTNTLANELRDEFITFYESQRGYRVLSKIFVTNKYGGLIAQTDMVDRFRYDREIWWQETKQLGAYIGQIEYDQLLNIYGIPASFSITNDNGSFEGVLKAIVDIKAKIRTIELSAQDYQTTRMTILTSAGKIIYRTKPYRFMEDFSSWKYFDRLKGDNYFFVGVSEANRKKLYSYAQSKGYKQYSGFGWLLIIENDLNEIMAPASALQRKILMVALMLIFGSLLIAYIISSSISGSLNKLIDGASRIGKGNMHHRVELVSSDELGQLANSFNDMVINLQVTTASRDDLNKEISDRIEAEKDLRRSEIKYRSMMESLTDQLYICSPEFIVEYMNPAMIKRLGRNATGETCHKCIYGLGHQCDWCVYDKVTKDETVETTIQSPLDSKHYRLTDMPIHNSNGTVSKMTIFRDITQYVEAVAEKDNARARLRQSQKMEAIGTLAGGIAHDFNNILAAIMGFSQLLLIDVKKGSTMEDDIQEILTASVRARDLINQVLIFARQSNEEIGTMRVDLIAKEVLQLIRSSIPTSIEIKSIIESKSRIIGNSIQCHQIIMNLCTNAAYAMEKEGGILEVRLQDTDTKDQETIVGLGLKSGDYIKIVVKDTGDGIPLNVIKSIFDPYFTTKPISEGTGMGLSVVHGIVESYGGKITVDSKPQKGTKFTIFIPVTKHTEKNVVEDKKELPTGTENILVVDDEILIAKVLERTLKSLGYSVTKRNSSIEALELFRSKSNSFDLVITDMTMPNMSGDNLAIKMIAVRPNIPIILCTGYSKNISEEKAFKIGIKAFVHKPIVNVDLAETIRTVLDDANNTVGESR